MENYSLTLKNIYRLLTSMDYPFYSDSVIPPSERKGLTLLGFWKQVLLSRWMNTAHGRIIWRTQGSRNRYPSELCNRKAAFPYYQIYSEEIFSALTSTELVDQTRIFTTFLRERRYRHDIFHRRLEFLIPLGTEQDPVFKEAADFFQNFLTHGNSGLSDLMYDSWILTILTLHAISGECMNSTYLKSLRSSKQYLPENILSDLKNPQNIINEGEYELLTVNNSELLSSSMLSDHFYGRENELFDLREALLLKKKLLITGIGGIGKTELMQQFLNHIINRHMKVRIAAVQFDESIKESFARSFLNLTGSNAQERCQEAFHILSSETEVPALLMIDNMNTLEDDVQLLNQLASLPCAVFISSRMPRIDGFTPYPVSEPDIKSSSLIFRGNCSRILSEKEKDVLDNYLQQTSVRHPLSLTFLGKSAGYGKRDIEELFKEFRISWIQVKDHESDAVTVEHHFQDLYKKLYSTAGLSSGELKILRVMSILPYRSYAASDILHFTFEEFDPDKHELLSELGKKGWLDDIEGSYRMHPIIAESIRRKHPAEQDYTQFWRCMEEKIMFSFDELGILDPVKIENSFLLTYAADQISGPISADLSRLAGQAGITLSLSSYADLNLAVLTERIIRKNPVLDDEMQCYIELMYLFFDQPHLDACEELIQKQQSSSTIPEDLYHVFYAMTASGYSNVGDLERVEQIYNDCVSLDLPAYLRFVLISSLANTLQQHVLRDRAERLLDEMLPTMNMDSYIGRKAFITLSLQAGQNSFLMGKFDDAVKHLENADAAGGENPDTIHHLMPRLSLLADIAMQKNDLVQAAEYMEESLNMIVIYSGKESLNYMLAAAKLALIYNKLGDIWRNRSYEYYETIIPLAERLSPDSSIPVLFANNYAVALLDGNEPDKALSLLTKSFEKACSLGDIHKAEFSWNLSRVWRMKNDPVQESLYLQNALPVFLEVYGKNHEKTMNAQARSRELQCTKPT